MRRNEPVTDREVIVPDDTLLVSATDTGGRIRFANAAFVEVSGFRTEELEGAPHNLVRHPHMPPAAFGNLWATIKAGRPWEGLVKNRTKTGDFYWVRANVTPTAEAGSITGYVSIRTRPTREEVAAAEAAYARINAGATDIGLRDGELVRAGWRPRLAAAAASVTGRAIAAGGAALVALCVVGWLGVSGMGAATEGLRTLYEDRTVPAIQLAEVLDHLHETVHEATLIQGDVARQDAVASRVAAVRRHLAGAEAVWQRYLATEMTAEENALIARFTVARDRFVKDGLEELLRLAERGDVEPLRTHLRQTVLPLFAAASALNRELSALQGRVAAETFVEARARDSATRWTILGASLALALAVAAIGLLAFRALRRPLATLQGHLEAIGRGEMRERIASPAAVEFLPVFASLRALRAQLAYAMQERSERDRRSEQARVAAVGEMADKVEREARSAVEAVAARTGAMAEGTQQLASAAERLGGNALAASQSAERALANTQSVAAATEELSASIREIATQTSRATEVVGRAVEGGRAAEATISSLAEAASRVNDVVGLISDVAARTNLLALNATIEAARAGEAGKGFAVVAGEVKQLAAQTARATADITSQLTGIQSATDAAVRAIGGMGRAINEISETAAAIAAAVEEQGAATQEIARNVAGNGDEVRDMAGRIEAVARDAGQAGAEVGRLRDETGSVDESVRALREGLVRVVRTSMAEAERRGEPRHPVSEPCLARMEDGRVLEGTLGNISAHGALAVGLGALPTGSRGTLELPRHRARVAFAVCETSQRGLHLGFEPEEITAEYRRAFQALAGVPHPAATVAGAPAAA